MPGLAMDISDAVKDGGMTGFMISQIWNVCYVAGTVVGFVHTRRGPCMHTAQSNLAVCSMSVEQDKEQTCQ